MIFNQEDDQVGLLLKADNEQVVVIHDMGEKLVGDEKLKE